MRRTGLRRTLTLAVAAVPLVAGGFVLGHRTPEAGSRIFQSVLDLVQTQAVDSLDPDTLYIRAARGLVTQLRDPYAGLFSPKDFASFSRNALGNRYGGVGLRIVRIRGTVEVWRVIPGGPAAAAGIERGDRFVQVGDSAVQGWSTAQVSDVLTGTPGTAVHVVLRHRGSTEPYAVDLVRAVITAPTVPYTVLLAGGVGYVPIVNFSDHSADDVARALAGLERQGATRFLLDLRDNPGGSLEQVVEMSSLFIDSARLAVRVRSREAEDSLRGRRAAALAASVPVAVLVDSGTASASEILAGALQDYDRALVVGTDTYGKGVAQGTFRLPDGWILKLTTARWLTPVGRQLQRPTGAGAAAPPTVARSFGGRTLAASGGIVPDVLVFDDTLPASARTVALALGVRATVVGDLLDSIAEGAAGRVRPDFKVSARLRTDFVSRLRDAGIRLPEPPDSAVNGYLDRLLDGRITSFALTDSAAFMRRAPADPQLRRALALLNGARTQAALLEEPLAADRAPGS